MPICPQSRNYVAVQAKTGPGRLRQNVSMTRSPKCDWCGVGLEEGEGLRLIQPKRNLGASFCRLEHMVPWLMKKNDWHIWTKVEVPESAGPDCARTGKELGEDAWYVVRHPGGTEVADGFIGHDAVLEWARAGGRYAPG